MPAFKQNNDSRDGFNKAYDLIQSSKNVQELTKAVEQCMQIVKSYGLDEYQQNRLEQLGMRRFNDFDKANRELDRICKHNKFKK